MNLRKHNVRRAVRNRRHWMRSGGIQLIMVPPTPVNPPPFEGPKEPASIRGFLRRWMHFVRSGEGKPEYATSLAQLAERRAMVGSLTNRQYRAFRRGKLKIMVGAYPKEISESLSSVDSNHVITENFTYKVVFES